jgi:hypothetical protein
MMEGGPSMWKVWPWSRDILVNGIAPERNWLRRTGDEENAGDLRNSAAQAKRSQASARVYDAQNPLLIEQ